MLLAAAQELRLGVGAQRFSGPEPLEVEEEPVDVGRVGPVLEDVVEGEEAPPDVVEDAVEDHAHPAGVGRVEELAEGGVAAEERVDPVVVPGVVAVVRGGGEDRVEVEGVHAEVLQVVELLGDAEEVAPLEAVGGRRGVPGLEVRGPGEALAPREAVGEDLVEDGVADPGGCLGAHPSTLRQMASRVKQGTS